MTKGRHPTTTRHPTNQPKYPTIDLVAVTMKVANDLKADEQRSQLNQTPVTVRRWMQILENRFRPLIKRTPEDTEPTGRAEDDF